MLRVLVSFSISTRHFIWYNMLYFSIKAQKSSLPSLSIVKKSTIPSYIYDSIVAHLQKYNILIYYTRSKHLILSLSPWLISLSCPSLFSLISTSLPPSLSLSGWRWWVHGLLSLWLMTVVWIGMGCFLSLVDGSSVDRCGCVQWTTVD